MNMFNFLNCFENFLNASFIELILNGLIGQGRLHNYVHSELRIFQVFYAAGLFNLILWSLIGHQLYRKHHWLKLINNNYTAFVGFLLTIIFSNWHYHSIFVYPNIFIIVLLIAFISSRTNKTTSFYLPNKNNLLPVR